VLCSLPQVIGNAMNERFLLESDQVGNMVGDTLGRGVRAQLAAFEGTFTAITVGGSLGLPGHYIIFITKRCMLPYPA
jgi:hypothetical protein